jgi:hypothetical protein
LSLGRVSVVVLKNLGQVSQWIRLLARGWPPGHCVETMAY